MTRGEMRLVFPWPDSRLNPNSSARHWWSKAAATRQAREEARIIAVALKQDYLQRAGFAWRNTVEPGSNIFPWERCRAHITWYPPQNRRRDFCNLLAALKPVFDAIVDAGILVDDSTEHLTIGETTMGKPDRVKPRVEIVIKRDG